MDIVLIEVEVTERKSHWCRSEIRHLWQTCSDTGSVSKREFPLIQKHYKYAYWFQKHYTYAYWKVR